VCKIQKYENKFSVQTKKGKKILDNQENNEHSEDDWNIEPIHLMKPIWGDDYELWKGMDSCSRAVFVLLLTLPS
jgi:hypothetical protein